MNIDIYTDGACSKNPGPGGWAYVLIDIDNDTEIFRASGAEKMTTNNRMELTAVIKALNYINTKIDKESATLAVRTDSQYVQQGISYWIYNWKKNNWKTSEGKPVKNQDLWLQLDEISEILCPKWFWVKGHAGNKYNELCDSLATKASKKV